MSGDYEFLCRIYGLSGASGNLEPQSCITKLEKWFPLQGKRAQSLKVYNVRMLVFKNNIEMRKRR